MCLGVGDVVPECVWVYLVSVFSVCELSEREIERCSIRQCQDRAPFPAHCTAQLFLCFLFFLQLQNTDRCFSDDTGVSRCCGANLVKSWTKPYVTFKTNMQNKMNISKYDMLLFSECGRITVTVVKDLVETAAAWDCKAAQSHMSHRGHFIVSVRYFSDGLVKVLTWSRTGYRTSSTCWLFCWVSNKKIIPSLMSV